MNFSIRDIINIRIISLLYSLRFGKSIITMQAYIVENNTNNRFIFFINIKSIRIFTRNNVIVLFNNIPIII